MIPGLLVRQTVRTLAAHRGWTLLTMFGLIWGTASIVLLGGWGEGFRQMLERSLAKTGKNLTYAWVGRVTEDFHAASDDRLLWLTVGDLEAVKSQARTPSLVVGESSSWSILASRGTTVVADVRGVEADSFELRSVSLAAGRPIRQRDLDHRHRVVVLGSTTKQRLFGNANAVGRGLRIGGSPYQVVGVLDRVGTELARDRTEIDEQAWIPITALFSNGPRYGTDIEIVDTILFRVADRDDYDAAVAEVRGILAKRLGVSAEDREALLFVSAIEQLRKMPLRETGGYLRILSGVTLVIAGVGVMNMMLVSVHDRRGEIGTRLAVGASPSDIVLEFVVETLLISLSGGTAGLLLGVAGCVGLWAIDVPDLVPIPVLVPEALVRGVGVLLATALLASLAPAWRAARVDPSVSVRKS